MPPIYDWKCDDCGHETAVQRPVDQYQTPPDDGCERCRSTKLRKTIKPTTFVLEGGGWHRDEYTKTRSIK